MVLIEIPLNGTYGPDGTYTPGPLTQFDCDPNNLSPECQLLLYYYGQVQYVPSLGGNAFYLAIFFVICLVQIAQGVVYKTWSYMICMICGLVLEAVGYGGRVGMHLNPWDQNPFLIQIICVTIAPIFFSACIYLCLGRLIILYDPANEHAHFKPRTYTIVFLSVDFLCLVLQAAGGAIADTAGSRSEEWAGVHTMIAGLALQVASLVTFSLLCGHFVWRLHQAGVKAPQGWEGRTRKNLYIFILGISAATIFILVRSCYRVAELSGGFGGSLANEEVPFMILEGAMIVLATLCLTIFHPGRYLGDQWRVKAQAGSSSASEK